MKILSGILRGLQLLPALILGIEQIHGAGTGKTKKEKVLEAQALLIGATEFIAAKDIVDEGAWNDGLSKAVDGVCQMFEASIWSKKKD